jgi:hypothetical protein
MPPSQMVSTQARIERCVLDGEVSKSYNYFPEPMELPQFAIIEFKDVRKQMGWQKNFNDVLYLLFEPTNAIHLSVAVIMWIS